jgi:hypothetical protein
VSLSGQLAAVEAFSRLVGSGLAPVIPSLNFPRSALDPLAASALLFAFLGWHATLANACYTDAGWWRVFLSFSFNPFHTKWSVVTVFSGIALGGTTRKLNALSEIALTIETAREFEKLKRIRLRLAPRVLAKAVHFLRRARVSKLSRAIVSRGFPLFVSLMFR